DPLVVALPASHRLAARRRLTLADLADEAFVLLRSDTSSFAVRLQDLCLRAGIRPRVVQTVAEVPAQLALVAAGLGVALVPRSTALHFQQTLRVAQLPAQCARAGVYAVTRRDDAKRAVQAFVQAAARLDGGH